MKAQKSAVRSRRLKHPVARDVEAAPRIKPPGWLTDEGLQIWQRLTPTLTQARLLTAADVETFGRYCRNFARWLKLQLELDRDGETYETETYLGGERTDEAPQRANRLKRANPAFLVADRIERQLLAAEDRFGLNPAERQRIFVARSQTGVTGDLFSDPKTPSGKRSDDPAATPTEPAEPIVPAIGFLN